MDTTSSTNNNLNNRSQYQHFNDKTYSQNRSKYNDDKAYKNQMYQEKYQHAQQEVYQQQSPKSSQQQQNEQLQNTVASSHQRIADHNQTESGSKGQYQSRRSISMDLSITNSSRIENTNLRADYDLIRQQQFNNRSQELEYIQSEINDNKPKIQQNRQILQQIRERVAQLEVKTSKNPDSRSISPMKDSNTNDAEKFKSKEQTVSKNSNIYEHPNVSEQKYSDSRAYQENKTNSANFYKGNPFTSSSNKISRHTVANDQQNSGNPSEIQTQTKNIPNVITSSNGSNGDDKIQDNYSREQFTLREQRGRYHEQQQQQQQQEQQYDKEKFKKPEGPSDKHNYYQFRKNEEEDFSLVQKNHYQREKLEVDKGDNYIQNRYSQIKGYEAENYQANRSYRDKILHQVHDINPTTHSIKRQLSPKEEEQAKEFYPTRAYSQRRNSEIEFNNYSETHKSSIQKESSKSLTNVDARGLGYQQQGQMYKAMNKRMDNNHRVENFSNSQGRNLEADYNNVEKQTHLKSEDINLKLNNDNNIKVIDFYEKEQEEQHSRITPSSIEKDSNINRKQLENAESPFKSQMNISQRIDRSPYNSKQGFWSSSKFTFKTASAPGSRNNSPQKQMQQQYETITQSQNTPSYLQENRISQIANDDGSRSGIKGERNPMVERMVERYPQGEKYSTRERQPQGDRNSMVRNERSPLSKYENSILGKDETRSNQLNFDQSHKQRILNENRFGFLEREENGNKVQKQHFEYTDTNKGTYYYQNQKEPENRNSYDLPIRNHSSQQQQHKISQKESSFSRNHPSSSQVPYEIHHNLHAILGETGKRTNSESKQNVENLLDKVDSQIQKSKQLRVYSEKSGGHTDQYGHGQEYQHSYFDSGNKPQKQQQSYAKETQGYSYFQEVNDKQNSSFQQYKENKHQNKFESQPRQNKLAQSSYYEQGELKNNSLQDQSINAKNISYLEASLVQEDHPVQDKGFQRNITNGIAASRFYMKEGEIGLAQSGISKEKSSESLQRRRPLQQNQRELYQPSQNIEDQEQQQQQQHQKKLSSIKTAYQSSSQLLNDPNNQSHIDHDLSYNKQEQNNFEEFSKNQQHVRHSSMYETKHSGVIEKIKQEYYSKMFDSQVQNDKNQEQRIISHPPPPPSSIRYQHSINNNRESPQGNQFEYNRDRYSQQPAYQNTNNNNNLASNLEIERLKEVRQAPMESSHNTVKIPPVPIQKNTQNNHSYRQDYNMYKQNHYQHRRSQSSTRIGDQLQHNQIVPPVNHKVEENIGSRRGGQVGGLESEDRFRDSINSRKITTQNSTRTHITSISQQNNQQFKGQENNISFDQNKTSEFRIKVHPCDNQSSRRSSKGFF